ncbi:MAG: zinc-binding dehydrogenase [Desulfurococcales archaeon]|jgi:acryloyl-coenzyme A reductase|nr:zinc-binding dehydrogenase [Desulfurococcales archaeon]
MRAVIMTGYGGYDVLVERDVEIPRVSRGEVLIRVRGCGVCYRDTIVRRGQMRARIPVIPGHEVSGEVVEVGEGVSGFEKGDLVASLIYTYDPSDPSCSSGRENICRSRSSIGEDRDGCYAEYISLPYWILVKIGSSGETPPEGYSIAACVIGTAIRALKTIGGISRGDRVLITGAGGGVGIHAVQVARALGAYVIAATRSDEKAKIVGKAGADKVIVYREGFAEEVRKLTDGEGVDYVLETVGGPTLDQSLRSVKRGGRIILIGNVDPAPQRITLGLVILRELDIHGVLNSTLRELREAIEMLRRGDVKPIINTIPLSEVEVRKAHENLETGSSIGRYVIKP